MNNKYDVYVSMIFASKNRHQIRVLQPLKLHTTPNIPGGFVPWTPTGALRRAPGPHPFHAPLASLATLPWSKGALWYLCHGRFENPVRPWVVLRFNCRSWRRLLTLNLCLLHRKWRWCRDSVEYIFTFGCTILVWQKLGNCEASTSIDRHT